MAYERQYCMICGEEFSEGDRIIELVHRTISHDRFLFHESCFNMVFGDERNVVEEIADTFGFEWDFAEE